MFPMAVVSDVTARRPNCDANSSALSALTSCRKPTLVQTVGSGVEDDRLGDEQSPMYCHAQSLVHRVSAGLPHVLAVRWLHFQASWMSLYFDSETRPGRNLGRRR